jgi:formate-dependent phosphoribosylglycinamide formyltransferase (GAR transformylase)
VSPAASAVAIAQDRIEEKAHFAGCGVPVAPYAVIETPAQLAACPDDLLPGILKTARMGYDGKGQVRVADRALAAAWDSLKQRALRAGEKCCRCGWSARSSWRAVPTALRAPPGAAQPAPRRHPGRDRGL